MKTKTGGLKTPVKTSGITRVETPVKSSVKGG